VEDDGPGLPLESREMVFQIGQRLDERVLVPIALPLGMILVVDRDDIPEGGIVVGEVVRQTGPDRVEIR
jgi:hypothetical protein